MLTLTEKAAVKILEIMNEENLIDNNLRIKICAGGCAGFQFELFFEEESPLDTDICFKCKGVNLVISEISSLYLDGTIIDYIVRPFEEGFKFNNSNFSYQCACGKSYGL